MMDNNPKAAGAAQEARNIQVGSAGIENFFEDFSRLGTDYMLFRLTPESTLSSYSMAPTRINGMMLIVVLGGDITLDINLERLNLRPNTVAVLGAECLLQLRHVDRTNLDAYGFFVSLDFLHNINIDVNMLTPAKFTPSPVSVLTLTDEEMSLIMRYLELIRFNTRSNTVEKFVRSISRCLLEALIYQIIQLRQGHSEGAPSGKLSRRSTYVRDFMQLLHREHRRERSVTYYAGRLYISPKYLSIVVKEATGRSAAQWIDDYVILEAKNLLRFSGKNVQQIAYELNFPNQSSFGKYFKHITGMSPTEFQRS